MANRSRVFVVAQLGEEVTPGVLVDADFKLAHTEIRMAMAGEPNREWMAAGNLVASASTSGLEWTGGTYEGPPSYDEFQYIANSVIKKVTPTGTTSLTRVWTPDVATESPFSTYTVERGLAGAVLRSGYMFFNSLRLSVSKRGNASITGEVMGQEPGADDALTASPTIVPSSPIAGSHFDLYTAATWAGLDSSPTQVTTAFIVELDYGPVHKEAAYINSANPSFDAVGTIRPANAVRITLPLDVTGTDFLGTLNMAKKRTGALTFFKLLATGAEIETGVDQTFEVKFAVAPRRMPDETDIDDVFWGLMWECGLYVDSTSGKFMEFKTISAT